MAQTGRLARVGGSLSCESMALLICCLSRLAHIPSFSASILTSACLLSQPQQPLPCRLSSLCVLYCLLYRASDRRLSLLNFTSSTTNNFSPSPRSSLSPLLSKQSTLVTVDYGDVAIPPPPKRRRKKGGPATTEVSGAGAE